jgi:hypothetical protein
VSGESADSFVESLPEQDFISSELTETLQFDGALFEQMLNPSIEDSPLWQMIHPFLTALPAMNRRGESASLGDMAVTDLTEDFDIMTISGTNEDKGEEHVVSVEEGVFDMSADSLPGMEVEPRPLDALIENSQTDEPESLIDEKEFFISSGDSSAQGGEAGDSAQGESGLIADDEGPVSADEIPVFAQEEQFPNEVVSDKTEIIEVAPSGKISLKN